MKVTAHAFLHWHKYSWEESPSYCLYACDMSGNGTQYVLIREIDVEVEVPDDFDPRPNQIATLRKEKTQLLAEAHVKAENIDEQIQRLIAIEHKPEVTT